MLPVIVLVGRPNVGKSTLFNRLTRTRDALVAMKESDPKLASAFHEYLVRLLSERLILTNRLVEALLR